MSEKHCSQKKLRKTDHFHILATVNSTYNEHWGTRVLWNHGFPGAYAWEGLLGHMVLQCLAFK